MLNLLQSQFCEYRRSLRKDIWRNLMRSLIRALRWTDKHIYAITCQKCCAGGEIKFRQRIARPVSFRAAAINRKQIVFANTIAWRSRIRLWDAIIFDMIEPRWCNCAHLSISSSTRTRLFTRVLYFGFIVGFVIMKHRQPVRYRRVSSASPQPSRGQVSRVTMQCQGLHSSTADA